MDLLTKDGSRRKLTSLRAGNLGIGDRGELDVCVNGTQVIADGKHTNATPGRVVRGPGWTGRETP